METPYIPLIESLCSAPGAPGFEDSVVEIARKYSSAFANARENSLRNLYLARKENTGAKPVVMLDAHSDEVGFMVQAIHSCGTLAFIELGSVHAAKHEGQRVRVRATDGRYIPGVISCPPPHFAKDGAEAPLSIDIGACCAQQAREEFGVEVGAPCVPDVEFHHDKKRDLIFAKAMDCRIGCAALLATMETLAGETLAVDVVGALTSQEEIGDRGALVAARTIQPKAAIVFEGAPADDTFAPEYKIQTALKKGPMLRLIDKSMVTNPRFARLTRELAKKEGIPLQIAVREGGATNGGCIHTTGDGVPAVVLSVPVRYVHSPNGIASYTDFSGTVQLATALIKALNEETLASFS